MNPHPPKSRSARGRPAFTPSELAEKREAIATAARSLFAADGYNAVSIRKVAEAAEMTPMTVYRYFDSKIDILRYLWSDVLTALFDSLDAIGQRERNASKRLTKICTAYVRYWIDHPDHYRMVFLSEGVSQPAVSVFVENDEVAQRYSIFARAISDVTGLDPAAEAAQTELLICMLTGIAHNHITISAYPWNPPESMVELFLGLLSADGKNH